MVGRIVDGAHSSVTIARFKLDLPTPETPQMTTLYS